MLTVKGTFEDGVARPVEPVEGREGQVVLITFMEERDTEEVPADEDESWDTFFQLIKECGMDTGIADLADQHDHYLYGKPKHE